METLIGQCPKCKGNLTEGHKCVEFDLPEPKSLCHGCGILKENVLVVDGNSLCPECAEKAKMPRELSNKVITLEFDMRKMQESIEAITKAIDKLSASSIKTTEEIHIFKTTVLKLRTESEAQNFGNFWE